MLIYPNYVDLWASKCSETVNDFLGGENHLGPCAIISCGKYNHSENAFKSFDFLRKNFPLRLPLTLRQPNRGIHAT